MERETVTATTSFFASGSLSSSSTQVSVSGSYMKMASRSALVVFPPTRRKVSLYWTLAASEMGMGRLLAEN